MKIKKYLFAGASGMTVLFFILGAVLVLMPGTVGAQEEYVLEDTIVTATKTGETILQETPISMSVFDDQMIDALAAFTLEDIASFSPSVSFSRAPFVGVGIFIRGIGETVAYGPNDQNISTYVDGVFIHQARGSWADMMDVERVEVLKGPQGVLWGRNNTGGAINLVTKKPSDELELQARVEVGNYSKKRVDAMISGPILKDKINARLAIADGKQDPLFDNLTSADFANENFWSVRGSFQLLPTDNLEILIRGDYYEEDELWHEASKLLHYDVDDPGSWANRALAQGYTLEELIPTDFYTANTDIDGSFHGKFWGLSAEILYDFANDVDLRSITSYREAHYIAVFDDDDTIVPFGYMDQRDGGDHAEWWTQEINLSGKVGNLQWVLGGDYLDVTQYEGPTRVIGVILGGYQPPLPYNSFNLNMAFTTQAYAGFGNLAYAFTEQLSVSAGVRYSYEDKTVLVDKWVIVGDMTMVLPREYGEAEWTDWSPRFVIDYKASDDIFLYGSVAKGFKSGSCASQNPRFGYPPLTEHETVWNYEVGVKSDWLDKRLRINWAAWISEYEDYQVVQDLPGTGPMEMIHTNAGGADIVGTELEFLARPTERLTLNGGLTYLDTEYVDLEIMDRWGVIEDASGNRMQYAPEWAFSLGASYVVPIEGHGFLTFGADMSYRGEVPCGFFSSTDWQMWMDSYTLVNARMRYETEDGQWALEGYVKNLLEEEYFRALDANGPDVKGMLAPPMTCGMKVTYKY